MTAILKIRSFSMLFSALALAAASGAACSSSSSASKGDAATGTGGAGTGGAGVGGSTSGGTGGGGGGALAALTVTSSAFAEGQTFPSENTCAGANLSPPLSWTAGPAGTMSYAVLLTDLSINVIHWVIWDIPAATHALAPALPHDATLTSPSGAKQAHHVPFFGAADNGYRGPCPSGASHNYQLEVHALDVATLPTVTSSSVPPDVETQISAHSLAHGDLTGTSTASMAGQ